MRLLKRILHGMHSDDFNRTGFILLDKVGLFKRLSLIF